MKEDIDAEELLHVINAAFRGAVVFSPNVLPKLIPSKDRKTHSDIKDAEVNIPLWYYSLSKKEKRILNLIIEGYENREISDLLFLGEQTVKNYVSIVYSKIGTHSRQQTIKIASPFKQYLKE